MLQTSVVFLLHMPKHVEINSFNQLLLIFRAMRPLRIYTLVPHIRRVVVELFRGFKEILLVSFFFFKVILIRWALIVAFSCDTTWVMLIRWTGEMLEGKYFEISSYSTQITWEFLGSKRWLLKRQRFSSFTQQHNLFELMTLTAVAEKF